MSKERMTLESLDNCDNSIMATYSQVISLGYIVGKDHPRVLADAREDGEKNSAL
jgi:hypothetical protein